MAREGSGSLKIAFVNQPWNRVTLPVRSGSIAIWTYEVARRLAESHRVVVYAKRDFDQPRVEWSEGVQYRRFDVSLDLVTQRVGARVPVGVLKKPIRFDHSSYFLAYIVRIAMDLRKEKCDVIHLHNFSQFAPIVRRLNRSAKSVLHMHCEWLTQVHRESIEARLRSVDRIVGCSRYITDTIRRAFPERSDSCHSILNGVDVSRFTLSNTRARESTLGPTILFVGRVSPEKGLHILLDAFTSVLEKHPGARLEIVGGLGAAPREFIVEGNNDPEVQRLDPYFRGDYVAALRQSVNPDVLRNVSFLGELSYSDLAAKYREADVFAYPSVWNEPFGLPVAEAMACGLPVVTTRGGGLREIVEDGISGILVERADPDALARALLLLLSDQRTRVSMGRAGRERIEKEFTWEKVARELSALYMSVEDGQLVKNG